MQPSQAQATIIALERIAAHFSTPFYLTPEFWAVAVALGIGIASPLFVEWLRRRPEKSALVFEAAVVTNWRDPASVPDSEPMALLDVGRLVIRNGGKYTARSVEAYIENISADGEPREDFIPVPLNWTHGQLNKDGPIVRNIYPNQTVYLDVFNNIFDTEMVGDRSVRLAVAAGHEVPALSQGTLGESVLLIKLYQESGQVTEAQVKMFWNGREVPKMILL